MIRSKTPLIFDSCVFENDISAYCVLRKVLTVTSFRQNQKVQKVKISRKYVKLSVVTKRWYKKTQNAKSSLK